MILHPTNDHQSIMAWLQTQESPSIHHIFNYLRSITIAINFWNGQWTTDGQSTLAADRDRRKGIPNIPRDDEVSSCLGYYSA